MQEPLFTLFFADPPYETALLQQQIAGTKINITAWNGTFSSPRNKTFTLRVTYKQPTFFTDHLQRQSPTIWSFLPPVSWGESPIPWEKLPICLDAFQWPYILQARENPFIIIDQKSEQLPSSLIPWKKQYSQIPFTNSPEETIFTDPWQKKKNPTSTLIPQKKATPWAIEENYLLWEAIPFSTLFWKML